MFATVSGTERGETDRLLERVVGQLSAEGVRVLGALRANGTDGENAHCNSDLRLLPDGPVARITQDLGAGSTSCRMDAGALEDAVGIAVARFAESGADLIVLNKFGLSEAEGRGFRGLIAEALGRGIPVLTGLTDAHRPAFELFAEGTATALAPEEGVILDWCRRSCRVAQA
ncbi:DUF2478 domain-containing protein [Primorskyibacter aestuariivivens]|uniref:DUF2478 domain-containing protein n=1 Tax=Primorskyibacter aestuariivivens TaxID=1888912 RepID=UPI002301E5CC|nr:DUF2478 domain-containing protein [Primorskyibacter aestuariivivens]MDA7427599.1 DUF2478 domain-containing protein [Primorskyibacter aestuariivivens]